MIALYNAIDVRRTAGRRLIDRTMLKTLPAPAAAASIGLPPARPVGDCDEDAAAVALVPVQLELVLAAEQLEAGVTDPAEGEGPARARRDGARHRRTVRDVGDHPERGVVGEEGV